MTDNGTRSAAAFRRTFKMTLASGMEVEVRKPDVSALIMANAETGNIPEPLVQQVMDQIEGNEVKGYKPTPKDLPGMLTYTRIVVKAALIWPKIVDGLPDYENGEISMDDLTGEEQGEIYRWAQPGVAAAAQTFPRESTPRVAAVPAVQDVQPKTKRPVRTR